MYVIIVIIWIKKLLVYIDISLVEEMVEDVARFYSRLSLLLIAEDEVYPVVQPVRHEVGLERRSVQADELSRVGSRPRRQHHVT